MQNIIEDIAVSYRPPTCVLFARWIVFLKEQRQASGDTLHMDQICFSQSKVSSQSMSWPETQGSLASKSLTYQK